MKTQTGRSMIEMLGVLAIIGVLSVGGLMGYQRAMNTHQANELVYYMNQCAVAVEERLGNGVAIPVNTTCQGLGLPATFNVTVNNNAAVAVNAQNFTLETAAAIDTAVADIVGDKGQIGDFLWQDDGAGIASVRVNL